MYALICGGRPQAQSRPDIHTVEEYVKTDQSPSISTRRSRRTSRRRSLSTTAHVATTHTSARASMRTFLDSRRAFLRCRTDTTHRFAISICYYCENEFSKKERVFVAKINIGSFLFLAFSTFSKAQPYAFSLENKWTACLSIVPN